MYVFYITGYGRRSRKVLDTFLLKFFQDIRRLGGIAGSGRTEYFRVCGNKFLKLPEVCQKLLLNTVFDFGNGVITSGSVFYKVFVIFFSMFKICQSSRILSGTFQRG